MARAGTHSVPALWLYVYGLLFGFYSHSGSNYPYLINNLAMELHNGVYTININGHLSSVGEWVEETDLSNRRILHTVRVNPIDSDGYFKKQ